MIKSSLIFSVVPSLSIVVGLFVLIAVMGSVWAWWRLSVIGSLSYETMISSSIAQVLGYASSAEMLEGAAGRQFGVVMILMSVGMLSGFLILLPLGKKLCKSVDRSAAESGGSTWKNVLFGLSGLYHRQYHEPEAPGGSKRHEPDQEAAQHPGR